MEYAPRAEREWQVTAYNFKNRPILHAKNLRQHEAQRLGDQWLARSDVSRVVGGLPGEVPAFEL